MAFEDLLLVSGKAFRQDPWEIFFLPRFGRYSSIQKKDKNYYFEGRPSFVCLYTMHNSLKKYDLFQINIIRYHFKAYTCVKICVVITIERTRWKMKNAFWSVYIPDEWTFTFVYFHIQIVFHNLFSYGIKISQVYYKTYLTCLVYELQKLKATFNLCNVSVSHKVCYTETNYKVN